MKERPIIFSGPMVRAIIEGRKTQTRRIVRGHPNRVLWNPVVMNGYAGWTDEHGRPVRWPYGKPGDRLWVRETWKYADWTEDGIPWIRYRADDAVLTRHPDRDISDVWAELSELSNYKIDSRAADRRWRPSIHMPRWASRITLDVTGVRVERLQEISEDDAIAEGVGHGFQMNAGWPDYLHIEPDGHCSLTQDTAEMSFATLWESLNGPDSWEANPWVWVIEFKRLEAPE